MYKVILSIGLLIYLLIPVTTQMEYGKSITAVSEYKPNDSTDNAQKFLSYILEHIHEGTLGGNIPLNLTKEDLLTNYGLNEEAIIKSTYNTSYFDRDGYRYFLMKNDGKEYLLVIGVEFQPLTKEQIFDIFGNKPYADSKMFHQIIYRLGDYSVMFTNTDEKDRESYNMISLSPLSPKFK